LHINDNILSISFGRNINVLDKYENVIKEGIGWIELHPEGVAS
jgi:hypothetical protein